jgi:arylformamidase
MLNYSGYSTAAEFDAGYANNIDAAVVSHWDALFREKSRECSDLPRVDLAYGTDVRNRIDFFPAPNAPADAPILVAIHGGLWFLFDRWMMHFLVPIFTAAGVHVACPNYRLAPQATLDDIVADCRRAIAYLHQHPQTGGRPRRLYVLGHSAAGQLAAVMASTHWPDFNPRLPADLLHGWIGVSGFYDIEPFAETGFQQQTKFAVDAYKRWNPINLIRTGMPPGLLITGARESGLLHEMMDGYAKLLRAARVGVTTIDAPDEDHFSVLARLGEPTSQLCKRALDLMR